MTDAKVINIVEKVLIEFNEDIVSSLKEKGVKAISLNTKQNCAIEVPEAKELGFVGIQTELMLILLRIKLKIN